MENVDPLLEELDLDARIAQLNQRLKGWDCVQRSGSGWTVTDTLRREVDQLGGIGAIYGLFRADPWSGVTAQTAIGVSERAEVAAMLSQYVVENSSHPIPPLLVEEAPHGLMAVGGQLYPTNLGMAAGWNPEAVTEAARLTAVELRESGSHLALVSGLDVARDPRWGRSEETYGEDPLSAQWFMESVLLGYGQVDGVGAVIKHFAAQGAGIGGRNAAGAPLGHMELVELHLPAARSGVFAGAVGVMAAYNDIDSVPCIANWWLLTELLRNQWEFDGIVMADGHAIDRLTRDSGSKAGSAAAALKAGVDLSLWDEAYLHIGEAVSLGLADHTDVARAARRVLDLKLKLGLLGRPSAAPTTENWRVDADRLARQVAAESLVLVKGDLDQLTLPAGPVAVVGPNADDELCFLGDYTPRRPVQPGIASVLASRPGWAEQVHTGAPGARSGTRFQVAAADLAALAAADTAVVVLGDTSERLYAAQFADNGAAIAGDAGSIATCGEGFDVADLDLPAEQLDLLRAAREAASRVIVVLVSGRARAVGRVLELADVLLYAPYPGPGGPAAIVDALLGQAIPTGRLPVSLPLDAGTIPVNHNERIGADASYLDQSAPAGTWGHGAISLGAGAELVRVDALVCEQPWISEVDLLGGLTLEVTAQVTNLTDRAFDHTVLLFGRRNFGLRVPRRAELMGLARVHLEPGQQLTTVIELGRDELLGRDEFSAPAQAPDRLVLAASGPDLDREDAVRLVLTPAD